MKTKRIVGVILTALAFLGLIGSIGALECNNITFLQCFIQGCLSGLLGWVGLALITVER